MNGTFTLVQDYRAVVDWFGEWPDFHDFEVASISVNRAGKSSIRVYGFETTRDLDSSGSYITTKEAAIDFWLHGIVDIEMRDFNEQNVIGGIEFSKEEDGIRTTFYTLFGVHGSVLCENISVTVSPWEGD